MRKNKWGMFDNPTQSPHHNMCYVSPCRPDLELQFKCYHHEDRQMNTNWPASVQVSFILDRNKYFTIIIAAVVSRIQILL